MEGIFSVLFMTVGLFFTLKSRCFPQRQLPKALCSVFAPKQEAGEGISVFSTLCTNLAATIGTGNILGVAAAILTGGPGALFWMLAASVVGMATKCAENLLAVRYRQKTAAGTPFGGPFAYIRFGLGKKFDCLGTVFAVACLLAGVLGMGTVTQSNSICLALQGLLPQMKPQYSALLISLVVTVLTALVIFGGSQKIPALTVKLVPFMAVGYIVCCVIILARYRAAIPQALSQILTSAFSFRAIGGGVLGSAIFKSLSVGVQRGIFSNEAGLGTSAVAAACSNAKDPMEQGFEGIVSVFIDTTLLCTLTGLTFLVTDAVGGDTDAVGAAVTAWELGLPFPPQISGGILRVFLALFSFTTVLGWNFYARAAVEWLCPSTLALQLYQSLYLAAVFLGPFLSADYAWRTADVTNAFMALPNLTALVLLRKEVLAMMRMDNKKDRH